MKGLRSAAAGRTEGSAMASPVTTSSPSASWPVTSVSVSYTHLVLAAVIARQRREDFGRRHTRPLGLGRVDIDHVLRAVDVESRIGAFDLRALVERGDELEIDVVEIVDASTGLHFH